MNFSTSQFVHKFIPSKDGQNRYLLALVHGRTGNVRLMEWVSKRFDIPSLSYICIQAPFEDRRSDQVDEGFSWYKWHPEEKDFEKRLEGLSESRRRLQTFLSELEAQGLPLNNFYWMGFSQGAAMGLDLFLRAPAVLGGLLSISGLCVAASHYPQELSAKAYDQKILITHGTRDEILSWEYAQKTYEPLVAAKLPIEFKIFDKPHSFHLRQEVPFLEERMKKWIRES